jgi:hypothetical protein
MKRSSRPRSDRTQLTRYHNDGPLASAPRAGGSRAGICGQQVGGIETVSVPFSALGTGIVAGMTTSVSAKVEQDTAT